MDSAYWLRSYSHKLGPLPEDKQPHVCRNTIQIEFGHNGLDINCFPLLLLFCTLISWWCFFVFFHYTPLLFSRPGATDSASSSSSSSSSFVNGATSKNLPAVQTVAPMPEDTMENMRSALSAPQSSLWLQPLTSPPHCTLTSFWLSLFLCWIDFLVLVISNFPTSFLSLFHFTFRFSSPLCSLSQW